MIKKLAAGVNSAVLEQLRRGLSPTQAALATALGLYIGLLPLLGLTMLVCFIAAWVLRLNHAVIQAANMAAYPLQLVLIFPFYWAGAKIFRGPSIDLSPSDFFAMAASDPLGLIKGFWLVGLNGVLVWTMLGLVVVPILWKLLEISFLRLKKD